MSRRLAIIHGDTLPDGAVEARCDQCGFWNEGDCELAFAQSGAPRYGNSKAIAHDSDAYHASLTTAPDYGCVQFVPGGLIRDVEDFFQKLDGFFGYLRRLRVEYLLAQQGTLRDIDREISALRGRMSGRDWQAALNGVGRSS